MNNISYWLILNRLSLQRSVILFSLFNINCSLFIAPASAQTGVWIGQRVEYDEYVATPLPMVLTLRPDSTADIQVLDANGPIHRTNWAMIGDRMRLDTNMFAPGQWAKTGQELRLNGIYPMVFRALLPHSAMPEITSTLSLLTGHSWAGDSLTYHLYANGSAGIENRRTGDVAQHCWQLADINEAVFLVLKGNRQDCINHYLFPIQVLQSSERLVTVLATNGYSSARQIWQRVGDLAPETSVQPRGFQPCQTIVYAPFALYPYKQFWKGRLGLIRQVVAREFKPMSIAGQSGLIRLRFVVNCMGQAGRWEVLELDENYRKRRFDPRITGQLLTICRTKLTDWEPGKDDDNQPCDTVCLLTFRLKDGLITEIFP